jgi:hypothetical protein
VLPSREAERPANQACADDRNLLEDHGDKKDSPAVYAISRPTAGAMMRNSSISLANCSG